MNRSATTRWAPRRARRHDRVDDHGARRNVLGEHGVDHKSATDSIEAGSFTALMSQAMERMHKDMSIASSGDPDRDFAAMMIPHHQGAVDMAKAELQFGKNPVLRRLAQGIIVEQLQEIEVMRRELQQLPAASKEP
jgi:uncharacterized protein (DUF305 family)